MSNTLANLYNSIQTQIPDVDINTELFGSERLPNTWQRFLHLLEISLTNATLSSQRTNDTFYVQGSVSLLSFGVVTVKISFFEGQISADAPDMQIQ